MKLRNHLDEYACVCIICVCMIEYVYAFMYVDLYVCAWMYVCV